jgi:hypothetical protein
VPYANAHQTLGHIRLERGQYAAAESSYRTALAVRTRIGASVVEVANSLADVAAAAARQGRLAEAESLLAPGAAGRAAIALCLDVGHQCVVRTSGDDRDPYAWLRRLGARSPVIHLQQSDAEADHHWPFTAAYNARGRIDAGRVLDALDASGAHEVALVLEVIPSFEQDDDLVLAELAESAEHWRAALDARR